MALFINANTPALDAQRNLTSSANSVDGAAQRLSSGRRVNSAKDDAAALAIAERLTAQVFGSTQAVRNANDGISLAQTAEGALSSTSDALQRIRELAVMASNPTLMPADRQVIQTEVNQLTEQVNQVVQTTTFNGQALLNGSAGAFEFQVGANAGETIMVSAPNLSPNAIGNNQLATAAVPVNANTSNIQAGGVIAVTGYLGTQTYATTATDTAQTIAQTVNLNTANTGVTATAQTNVNLQLTTGAYAFSIASNNAAPAGVAFTVTGEAATANDFASGIEAINAQTAQTGVTAQFDQGNGGIRLINAEGNNITVANGPNSAGLLEVTTYAANDALTANALSIAQADAVAVANGTVTFNSPFTFTVGEAASGLGSAGSLTPGQVSILQSVAEVEVTTFDNAQLAIMIADGALASVAEQRGQFGALQNRFEATVNNLQVSAENTTAARSHIQDADFASETANMSRSLILQQTGTAILAQANQFPERVLALLLQ